VLLLAAAGILLLGTFLPWLTVRGESMNGFSNYYCAGGECTATNRAIPGFGDRSNSVSLENPGVFTLVGVVVLAVFGIVLLAVGRVVTIAVLALICSGVGLLIAAGLWVVANRVVDSFSLDAELGAGPPLVALSGVVGLIGAIVALAQRTPRTVEPSGPVA